MSAAPDAIAVRRYARGDAGALEGLVEEARLARALDGSSDPSGDAVTLLARMAPSETALAFIDGRPVGFAAPEVKTIFVTGSARGRGVGHALVAAAEAIERERHRPNTLLGVLPSDEAGRAFLKANGFALHSIVWELALAPGRSVAEPAFPEGIGPRGFVQETDIASAVGLYNAVFADHPTPLIMDTEGWDDADDGFEPDDLLLLEERLPGGRDDESRLVGFCWTDPGRRPDGTISRSEIFALGVSVELRGRGLGRELLRWGIQRLRAMRSAEVTLTVNGYNEGALRLYESEGFTRTGTRERWARPIRPR